MPQDQTTQQTPEIKTVDQLKDRISALMEKSETHLGALQEVVQGGSISEALQAQQKSLETEIAQLVSTVEQDQTLANQLREQNTEYAVHLNNLKAGIAPSSQEVEKQGEKPVDRQTQIANISKDKRLLGAGVAGAGVGFYQGYNSSTADIDKSESRRGRTRKRAKGLCNGLFQGALYGAGAMLGVKGVQTLRNRGNNIKDGLAYIANPKQRATDALNRVKGKFSGLAGLLGMKSGDIYDAGNREVAEQRLDKGFDEITMYDAHHLRFFNKDKNQEEFVAVSENIEIPEALIPSALDQRYNSPTFTDRYLLTVKTANVWISAAQVRVREKAGTGSMELGIIEQQTLKIQQMVTEQKPQTEIETQQAHLLQLMSNFEEKTASVIGPSDRAYIGPYIYNHHADLKDDTQRKNHRELTEKNIYEQCRSTGGYGNSDVVANRIMDDLANEELYTRVMEIFDGENKNGNLLNLLENTSKDQEYDESLATLLNTHFIAIGVTSFPTKIIVKNLIETYHETKARIPQQEGEIKKGFNRNFGGNIGDGQYDASNQAQQAMLKAYEANAGEELKKISNNNSYPEGITMEQRWTLVHNYARESSKKQMLYGSIMHTYRKTFFDEYLDTKPNQTPKEKQLADIIGSGYDVSDENMRLASEIGLNVAISLIPMIGAELVIAGAIARMGIAANTIRGATMAARVARIATRAVIGHSVMTVSEGILTHQSISQIRGNFTDRKEFAKNGIFFNAIGRVSPLLQKYGQGLKTITPSGKIGATLLPILSSDLFIKIGAISGEAGVITGANCLDPEHDWSWGEFMTVAMMSLAMQSKLGDKIRNYTATVRNGKVTFVPKHLLRVAQGIETGTTKNATSLRTRYRTRLNSLQEGEEAVINGLSYKKIGKTFTTTEGTIYNSVDDVLRKVNLKGIKPEQLSRLRVEEVGASIEQTIMKKQVVKIGGKECKFEIINGEATLLQKTAEGKFVKMTEKEITAISQKTEKVLLEKLNGRITNVMQQNIGSLPKSIQEYFATLIKKPIEGIKNFTLGDIYPMYKNNTFNIKQILLGNPNTPITSGAKPLREILQTGYSAVRLRPVSTLTHGVKAVRSGVSNAQSLFSLSSVLYGGFVGDDGDTGMDEGIENYVLYQMLGRSIPLKILAYMIDETLL